jgi:hypothetical protein
MGPRTGGSLRLSPSGCDVKLPCAVSQSGRGPRTTEFFLEDSVLRQIKGVQRECLPALGDETGGQEKVTETLVNL